jgi:hypothetical protein
MFDDVLSSWVGSDEAPFALGPSKPERRIEWQAHRDLLGEHVAGPNCVDSQAYNGNHISVEEMRLCNTVQCLIEKESQTRDWLPEWDSESDDEEFEGESSHFLSGLGDRIGSWEDDAHCSPERHDVGELDPAIGTSGFASGDMAFHPYCLEIYRRVSTLRVGTIDIEGLAIWWDLGHECSAIPMHAAIRRGTEQWWQHRAGDEFLAANPLQIPALTALFDAASRPYKDFNARSSPFTAQPTKPSNNSDLFERLPEELRDIVLAYLSSKDIANLRLASRTFYYLPITLWHDLMQKELPWIWEAWTDRPYSALACTTRNELDVIDESLNSRLQVLEALDGDQQAAIEQAHHEHKERYAEMLEPQPVRHLHRLRTDWYWLYCQINRGWKDIKGLQNRERIWKTLEFVVRRVNRPDEDVRAVVDEHKRTFLFRFERVEAQL